MPAPLPIELKQAAIAAFQSGETVASVAERFGVGSRSVVEWSRRLRETGSLEPAPRGGGNFSDVDIPLLLRVLEARRDATTEELTRAYNKKRPAARRVSRSSILRALKREGFVFKKNVRGPQNRTVQTFARNARRSNAG